MKLVYILNHYSNSSASHFHHVLNLLEVMANKGVEIALIIEKCEDIPEIHSAKIKLYAQQSKNRFVRPIELFKILLNLHGQGYRHIFVRISWVAAVVSGVYGRLMGSKVFYWLSGQGKFETHADLPFGLRKLKDYLTSIMSFRASVALVHKLVTGPESMIDYFVNVGGVKRENLLLLYNDIDLKRFSQSSPEARRLNKISLGFDPDQKIVFFAHRFSPVRKTTMYIPYIIERFFENADNSYLFVLAGGGPEQTEVRQQVEKSKYASKIRLIGSIPNKLIQDYYRAADIFINPTYAEGFPRVLIEAMASGLPIVTTDAGGIRDIVGEKQSIFTVSKNDPSAFADCLVKIAKSDAIANELSNENISSVSKFSTDNVSQMYINLIFKGK
jgi:glycosyltransferase involved in cell wall biosynthesis